MSASITLSYAPADNGGVDLHVTSPQAVMRLPLTREQAAMAAANILHNAGVERFEFGNGQFRELA